MAAMTAVFKATDEITDKLDRIARSSCITSTAGYSSDHCASS